MISSTETGYSAYVKLSSIYDALTDRERLRYQSNSDRLDLTL